MAMIKGMIFKKSLLGVLFSTMLWPALCLAGEGDLIEQDPGLPLEISGFYNDHNFVVGYSTPWERRRIRHIKDSEVLIKLPERLKRIGMVLNSIDSRILGLDEGILGHLGHKPAYRPLPPPEIFEIIKKRENGPDIMVHVRTRPLSPSENVLLISQYEQRDMKEFQFPGVIKKRGTKNIPRLEIHKWKMVDGKWMKRGVNIVFVENQN